MRYRAIREVGPGFDFQAGQIGHSVTYREYKNDFELVTQKFCNDAALIRFILTQQRCVTIEWVHRSS